MVKVTLKPSDMKKTVLLILVAMAALAGCKDVAEKEEDAVEKHVCVYLSDKGNFKFKERIGTDLESALDSLLTMKATLTAEGKELATEEWEVKRVIMDNCVKTDTGWHCVRAYKAGDRRFYAIKVKDIEDGEKVRLTDDVIDTKGCWYVSTKI